MLKINWVVLLISVISGLVFAAATIFAWIGGWEHVIALLMFAGLGKLAAWVARGAPKRNAFAAGFIAAVAMVLTQALFIETYFANNPAYREIEIPLGLSPRAYIGFFAPLFGLGAGLFAMTAGWIMLRFVGPKR